MPISSSDLFRALYPCDREGYNEFIEQLEGHEKHGVTALLVAAMNGQIEVVEWLLAHGASLEEKTNDGSTALHFASGAGKIEMVECLLAHGASLDERNKHGWTALLVAAQYGKVEMVRWLLAHGASLKEKSSGDGAALLFAARAGKIEMVECLLAHGASLKEKTNDGSTALLFAAQAGKVEMVDWLLAHGASLDEKENDGSTALLVAARAGKVEMVEWLLAHGASLDERNNNGSTALHVAAGAGKVEMVEWLLAHGASLKEKANRGGTALLVAALHGQIEMVEWLLAHGASLKEKSSGGGTALLFAAQAGKIEMVGWLLAQGASLKEKSNVGSTALLFAARAGKVEVVKWLLAHGASLDERNNHGLTALLFAAQAGKIEMVEWLLAHGASLKEKTNDGSTALLVAARAGKVEMVEWLLAHGASLKEKNEHGWTALLFATLNGQIEMVEWLFEHGASLKEKTSDGSTPLLVAAHDGQIQIVEWLLAHGASLEEKDIYGRTPTDMARSNRNDQMVAFLEAKAGEIKAQEAIVGRQMSHQDSGGAAGPADDRSLDEICAGIDPKYLPIPRTLEYPDAWRPKSVDKRPMAQVHFRSLASYYDTVLPAASAAPATKQYTFENEWMGIDFYSTMTNPSDFEACRFSFILAGRRIESCFPSSSDPQVRVVLVFTEEEHQHLLGQGAFDQLPDHVDRCVIQGLKQPWAEKPIDKHRLGLPTTRRIAILLCALSLGSKFPTGMLDDNISHINLPSHEGEGGDWKAVFEILATQLVLQAPVVSVLTKGPMNKFQQPKLGAKLFLIDLHRIVSQCPCIPSRDASFSEYFRMAVPFIFTLFHEQLDAWGGDYMFQLAVSSLFGKQSNKVLDVSLISLERKRGAQNAAKARLKQAKEQGLSAVYVQYLKTLGLHEVTENAVQQFNRIVRENIASMEAAYEKSLDVDMTASHARANGLLGDAASMGSIMPRELFGQDGLKEALNYFVDPKQRFAKALRPYQRNAIQFIRNHMGDLYAGKRLTLEIATGCGKSLITYALAIAFSRVWMHDDPESAERTRPNVMIITPYRSLVDQLFDDLKKKIDEFEEFMALGFDVSKQVIKIYSDETGVSARTVAENRHNNGFVYLCCASSAKALVETYPEFISTISVALLDEVHVYQPLANTMCELVSTIDISATPPPVEHKEEDTARFTYGIKDGIEGGYLAPYKIDRIVFPDPAISHQDQVHRLIPYLPDLLANQCHPSAFDDESVCRLKDLKGAIFFDRQSDAKVAESTLKASGFPAYLISSDNPDRNDDLKSFVQSDGPGIVLAVKMLHIGFDCPPLHYVLNLKSNMKMDTQIQILGRAIRKCGFHKIGYMLTVETCGLEMFYYKKNAPSPYCLEYLSQFDVSAYVVGGDGRLVVEGFDGAEGVRSAKEGEFVFMIEQPDSIHSPSALGFATDPLPGPGPACDDDGMLSDEDEETAAVADGGMFSGSGASSMQSADEHSDETRPPKRLRLG